MSWKANVPSDVVTVACSIPVAVSVAFTCAFGTELPDGSVTVPLMAPRNVWAFAAKLKVRITSTTRNNLRIHTPPDRDLRATPQRLLLPFADDKKLESCTCLGPLPC